LLREDRDALQTPHGVDLYARILYAAGQRPAARKVWEELLSIYPDFEPAQKALTADECTLKYNPRELFAPSRRRTYVMVALAAIALGIAYSFGKKSSVVTYAAQPESPKVVAETVVSGPLSGGVLKSIRDGLLTNLTEETVLVISGGSGRYVTDRQRKLAVVADCLKEIAKVPTTKMYFQPGCESSDAITFQIVPAFSVGKESDK